MAPVISCTFSSKVLFNCVKFFITWSLCVCVCRCVYLLLCVCVEHCVGFDDDLAGGWAHCRTKPLGVNSTALVAFVFRWFRRHGEGRLGHPHLLHINHRHDTCLKFNENVIQYSISGSRWLLNNSMSHVAESQHGRNCRRWPWPPSRDRLDSVSSASVVFTNRIEMLNIVTLTTTALNYKNDSISGEMDPQPSSSSSPLKKWRHRAAAIRLSKMDNSCNLCHVNY